ncbi:MAG TPA: polymer-forming cytoskeletal protein [Pyrinomonadaceae bacterium]|jgi:cytoskeletal protein CcmA (bactofilin family)
MFRPGKPKDEPEPHHPQPHPQQSQPAPAQAANEDTQQRYRASEQTSSTGVRGSMNDGQANSGKAYTESDALARDIKEGTLTGFVGNGTNMTGEANFKGMLRVDGHLSGRVSSQDGTLIVSTGGQVDANVEVSVAQIYGTVNGDIIASKRIELGRVAKVTGNIQTPALVIEQGAIFEGSCRMAALRDEQAKSETRAASAGTSAAAPGASGASGSSGAAATSGAAKADTPSASTASSSGGGATASSGAGASSGASPSPGAGGSPAAGAQKPSGGVG